METALSSSAQRKVLAACISGALSVKAISDATGVPIASAYRQVNVLHDTGLLVVERSAMTDDGKPYDLYRSRLRRAAIEVTAAGSSVAWEVSAPVEERLVHMWGQLGWA